MAHIEKTDKAVERQSRVIKQNRSYFKAQITSLSKFVESFTESKRESIKLQERITRIRSLFQKFNDNQDELGILTEDYDVVELEREEISNAYDEALAAALELQESLSIKPNGNDENVNLYEPKITANKISVNLPNINLPKFDGRIEKWVTFRDAFLSMIDSDKGLSKIQKLTYLTLSLTGEAKESIEAFTISEENYDVVWNHLTEIYNNQRVLVLRHATLLRETPFMKNDSSDAIRELVRHMQLHIRSLEALGRTWEDIANDILTSIVISRMGDETRKAWEHTLIDTEVPKVNDIFKHLHNASHQSQDYASIACMNKPSINMSSRPANKRENQYIRQTRSRNSPPSSPKFQRRIALATQARVWPCSFCKNEGHRTYQCPHFLDMNVEKRIEAVKNAKLCLNCLLPNHSAEKCRLRKCQFCNLKHNSRLHKHAHAPLEKINARSDPQLNDQE
ncbi:uncharacterized protein LOC143262388 [Megalopta genalis]|uniref:uncharacterized protein LOC143262388 n=1 Tax=Megalopta genalis TaxID=115081 RepID=UPI003FD49A17